MIEREDEEDDRWKRVDDHKENSESAIGRCSWEDISTGEEDYQSDYLP